MDRISFATLAVVILMSAPHCPLEASPAPEPPAVPAKVPPVRQATVQLPQRIEGRVTRQFKQGDYSVSVDLSEQILHLEMPKDIAERQKGQFEVGDLIRVKRNASLRRGTTALANVAAAQQLTVHRVHTDGKWIEAGVVSAGRVVRGWLAVDEVEFVGAQPRLQPTLGDMGQQEFASAAILAQKAKQFDDGLMAAIQLAAQTGHGKFAGKRGLLERLAQRLGSGKSAEVVLAACVLGKVSAPVPPTTKAGVDDVIAEFLAEPARSKPIAFYTWNSELSALFQQDRMLQSNLNETPGGALAIARAFQGDAAGRAAYEAYLNLQSRLTNPQVAADLRPLLAALDAGQTAQVDPTAVVPFLPASYSHEVDLLKRMFPDGLVPPEFNLMEELVARVKSGKLDLTPRPDSGWYDRQIWSLEPYVRPQQMPEGSRWNANDEYHGHLTKLFKGVWALARETHIKDLELFPPASAEPGGPEAEPKIKINIQPELSGEPVATAYLRRALGYRFVRDLLTEQFGEDSLKKLHRLTATGSAEQNLDDELRQMEGLFHGAYVTTTRQLGMAEKNELTVGSGMGPEEDAKIFLTWAANLQRDPDLGTDARMMIPLYYDPLHKKTKVWAVLGWTTQTAYITFEKAPTINVSDKAGQPVKPERLEVSYHVDYLPIATPVFRELFVTKLLNRDEFRQHCDAYESVAAIVDNLER